MFNATASIAQNYHSLVQTAVMRDEDSSSASSSGRQLSLMVRRTMGVASLSLGEMEYMLMRRITTASDNQGPWPLDDTDPMEEEHVRLLFGSVTESERQRFVTAAQHEHPLTLLYVVDGARSSGVKSGTKSSTTKPLIAAATNAATNGVTGLPSTVWSEIMVRQEGPRNGTYVVRLQNMVPSGESIQVPSLSKILSPWKLVGCVETTLTMQQTRLKSEQVRLTWISEKEEEKEEEEDKREETKMKEMEGMEEIVDCDTPLLLDSLDLRTFVFDVTQKKNSPVTTR
jgi:hypothetical protein